MKKIKFFAMALAAVAIVSCSKENMSGDNNESGNVGEPTYATFSFKTGAASTKAGEAEKNEVADGTGTPLVNPAETVIKTARLLIFSTNGQETLETNKLVTLTTNGKKFTEVVNVGTKRMYVIANETAAMTTTLGDLTPGTTTLATFLELTYDAGAPNSDKFSLAALHTNGADFGFPMSSPNDKTFTFEANVTKEQTEAAAGAKNAFTLSLDFMLSKVAVVAADAVLDNTILKATNMKFSIRNIAKETYFTQQFVDADAKVVKSAYYEKLPENPNLPASWALYYHQTPMPNVDVTENVEKFIYTAENTKSTASLLAGGSTYAAISCVITPKSSYDGTDMKWSVYNAKLALGTAKPIADPENGVGVDFIVTLKAFNGINVGTVFTNVDILNKALTIIKFKETYVEGTTPIEKLAKNTDYQTYTKGIAWYRINISKTEEKTLKPIYGVERGLQYTATINSITGFGLSGDDLAPETPLDQQTYISATITAKGWTDAGSSTNL